MRILAKRAVEKICKYIDKDKKECMKFLSFGLKADLVYNDIYNKKECSTIEFLLEKASEYEERGNQKKANMLMEILERAEQLWRDKGKLEIFIEENEGK